MYNIWTSKIYDRKVKGEGEAGEMDRCFTCMYETRIMKSNKIIKSRGKVIRWL
jgi:hypothetical protein